MVVAALLAGLERGKMHPKVGIKETDSVYTKENFDDDDLTEVCVEKERAS